MQPRRQFLMTVIFSAIKLKDALWRCHPNIVAFTAKRRLHTSPEAHSVLHANPTPWVPAFQLHQYFSVRVSTLTPPPSATKLLHSSPFAKSDLITKWADPGQISSDEDYVLCFAGRSLSNNGNAGSGMVLYDSKGNELWRGHQSYAGEVTTNEAEYMALVTGLKSVQNLGVQRITAQGCNELVYLQMEGIYRVKKPSLKEYYEKAVSLSQEFASFHVRHVELSLNKRAVELAKNGMAMQSSDTLEGNSATTIQDEDGIDMENMPLTPSPTLDVSFDPASISPEKTYVLRFDGGARGNPGTAGAGMVLYDSEDGSEIWSGYQYLGEKCTNNEAEYMGLITGLQCARSLGVQKIVAQGDSQLILRQIDGVYKVKSLSLKDYYNEAISVSTEFASFETNHIERARNARADELANKAMDTKSSKAFDN